MDIEALEHKFPILGVCYGAQYIAQKSGGEVKASSTREYGRACLDFIDHTHPLFKNIPEGSQTWMSHADTIASIPDHFEIIASTDSVKVAAYHIKNSKVYGIQFHPEVTHSTDGKQLLQNFLVDICGCKQDWTPDAFIETTIQALKDKIGNDKVILGLSGGGKYRGKALKLFITFLLNSVNYSMQCTASGTHTVNFLFNLGIFDEFWSMMFLYAGIDDQRPPTTPMFMLCK